MVKQLDRWPFDPDKLQKGDVIPSAVIERYLGARNGTDKFRLGLLALKERVERELDARGLTVCTREDHGDLRVLTDSEAAAHSHSMIHRSLRGAVRYHGKQLAVDAASLTDDERHAHERNCIRDGRFIQAIHSARKPLPLQTHQRTTPGLTDQTA